jgi:hypothetical protein
LEAGDTITLADIETQFAGKDDEAGIANSRKAGGNNVWDSADSASAGCRIPMIREWSHSHFDTIGSRRLESNLSPFFFT